MELTVRQFEPNDAEAFRQLHREYLTHHKLPPATSAQEDRVLSCLSAERHMSCHLAFADGIPVGFATWGLNFPAGTGLSLVMKELFVSSGARQRGVGKALLSALTSVAKAEGCERFDWATDGKNTGAQSFYKSIGASEFTKKNYRVLSNAFDEFQSSLEAKDTRDGN